MVSRRTWLDRNLAPLGIAFLISGAFMVLLGIIGEIRGADPRTFDYQSSLYEFYVALYAIGRFAISIGNTLIFAGVIMYCFGRFVASSFVTIVGFEHTKPSELSVRGPDEENIVWVGRRYPTSTEAEVVAKSLGARFGGTNS